jgi:hypothetical protein
VAKFQFAALNPTQQPDRDAQANAQQESAAALVASLRELRHHLLVASPLYAYSDPIVFGGVTTGANAAYALPAEFQTPCQYRVIQVAFGGAGTALIGQQSNLTAPGLSAKIDPSSRQYGQVYAAPGALTVSGAENWTDLPAGGQVYLAVNVTTDSAWATVQFRRRVSPAGVYSEGHD